VAHSVSFSAVVAGTVESFDQAAYKASLASAIGVSAEDVELTVSAASVRIEAVIHASSTELKDSIVSVLESLEADPAAASALLGVTIESIDPVVSVLATVSPPPQPSSSSSMAASPLPPPSTGEASDAPCFARGTRGCRAVAPFADAAGAFLDCFGQPAARAGAAPVAELVRLEALGAGDHVLTVGTEGELAFTRVLINQHRTVDLVSSVLTLKHSEGSLTLTPDHVLSVDGAWKPARLARPGSRLYNGATVQSVSATSSGIVNPLTTAGTLLTNGVLSSTYPEWIAPHMLNSKLYPLPLSACNLLTYLFPLMAQAFYDESLEPIFGGGRRAYLEAVPSALVTPTIMAMDLAITLSFVAATSLGSLLIATVLAAAVGLAARKVNQLGY